MSEKQDEVSGSPPRELYKVVKERLKGTKTHLTDFFFRQGGNFYVFSYKKDGVQKHTFIDAGDSHFRHQIMSILIQNDINPSNIERIIITHRHPDHCGLTDLLAGESKAKILVHPNFKRFVEGEISKEEWRWLGEFDPRRLKEYDIEYLPQPNKNQVKIINGVGFPTLGDPIEIGEGGELEILACPEDPMTHSPDQVLILYSPSNHSGTLEESQDELRPTDNIVFSGDLWLIRGPLFNWGFNISRHFRLMLFLIKNLMSGNGMPRRNAREQDATTKEALKRGFDLIRVKPGHGEEFIGSSLIPRSLLANRDLLVELGYSMDASRSILRRGDMLPRIAALQEQAYSNFIKELLFWREVGYTPDETAQLLIRIYIEQSGGGRLVEKDRKERRIRIKATLARLKDDDTQSEELRQLAQSTLLHLKKGK